MGKIDILVNNAGFNMPQAIDQIRDKDWDRLVELNLTSCMALTRALVPGMKERRWGRVIHISSIMGLVSTAGRNAYSATKAALLGLARASALDLGPFNITVNCIAPGPFATEMPMSILSPEQQAALAARTALGRWARPEELAGPALLLASEAGSCHGHGAGGRWRGAGQGILSRESWHEHGSPGSVPLPGGEPGKRALHGPPGRGCRWTA